ncbi:MAG: Hsp20/alpha crystallin family protein, partial [Caldivirga sp.]|nr:Hsp20/alpha crystallin family protein [Caldivirga sp.]
MSWFEDFDEWFKKWRRFIEEFEREVEKEFEEAFKPFSEEQPRGGRRSKGNVYYYGFEITMGPDGKPKIR